MKKTYLIFYCLLLVIDLVNAQEKTEEIEAAIKDKDYPAALAMTKEILDAGQPSVALKYFIRLREFGVNDKKLFEYIGDTYAKMDVLVLATENYEEVEKIDSLDTPIKFKGAEILYKQKRYTEAVNKYLKIIAIDPNNAKAYGEAARIFYLAKLYADASVMYEKYIAIEQTKEAYESITNAFLEIKNYDKVFSFGTEGINKYPEDLKIAKNTAIAAYALKKYGEAADFYRIQPDSEMTTNDLVNAARSFQQIKADSTALIYFEKAVNRDSTLSNVFMDLANGNYLNKNYEVAVKYYAAKIKSDSTYEPAYRFMAFALMQLQRYDDTRKAFLKSTELNDTLVTTRFWLAQTYRQLDSSAVASEQYQKMLQIIGNRESQYKNECAEAYGFLGQRAFERKNYAGSIGFLRKAVTLKSDVLGYKVMLASSLHQNGNIDEAIEWYRRILKIDLKNEIAKKGLRMLSAD